MTVQELTAKARELKKLSAKADELAEKIKTIEDEIKAHMGETEEVHAGVYKIRYAIVKSNRFDTAAFRKAMPDLAQQFTRTAESRRFTIA